MGVDDNLRTLVQALQAVGLRVSTSDTRLDGFPLVLNLPSGPAVTLNAPEPGILSLFDPDIVGLAIINPEGYPHIKWGLAEKLDIFSNSEVLTNTPIGRVIDSAYSNETGSMFLNGYRYYAAQFDTSSGAEVLLMVLNANEEADIRSLAKQSSHSTRALKRIGKTLTSKLSLQSLAIAAVNTITSAADLVSVLLWTRSNDREPMRLIASVGASRTGIKPIAEINTKTGKKCVAEIAANTRQLHVLENVIESPLTKNLEGKFCYLKPGGLMAMPLENGDDLVGVLEIIGRASDKHFVANQDLFTTIAEHLSLAIANAIMFENMQKLASYDALTGIANHRTMQEFLQERVSEASRSKKPLGVVMLDVDHFRSFNEEEGHDAGDKVLKMVADVLEQNVRSYDKAARYGGEEFALILPNSDYEKTFLVAERVRESIAELVYTTQSGRSRHITASLGCAIFPECSQDAAGLLKAADTALFRAKREGRNRTVMYDGIPQVENENSIVDIDRLRSLVPGQDSKSAEKFLSDVKPYIRFLSHKLHLGSEQVAILTASSLFAPTYFRVSEANLAHELASLEKNPDLRVISPCLEGMLERFDGLGPNGARGAHIPLLGRIMAVLRVLVNGSRSSIYQDTGRFDPEIVEAIEDFSDAA